MAAGGRLSRRTILEAALGLADREGLESVTMRRISEDLGVGTMSLYYHVPNKVELLTGMVDIVFEEVELAPQEIEDWVERLAYASRSFRRAALMHPVVVTLIASGYVGGTGVLRNTDDYLEAILTQGFGVQEATHIFRCTASYAVGYLSLETGGYFQAIGEIHRPGELDEFQPDEEFEVGLRQLLAGFAQTYGRTGY